ncbi:MAG: DMT family transporter [Candidatus Thermoplasmatota archaeon]
MAAMHDAVERHGQFAVAVAIVSVSTSSILIRWSASGPLTIAFYRLLFTTCLLLPWVAAHNMGEIRAIDRGTLARLAGVGLVLAAHFSLWVTSLGYTSVANSVVLVTIHPLFVAAISRILLREHTGRWALAGGMLASAGVVVMFIGGFSLGTWLGDLLALGGAVAAGTYIVAGRSERRRMSTGAYCLGVYGFTTLFLAPMAYLESGLVPETPGDWYLFLAMAAVPGIMGHTMYNYALGRVSAFFVSTSLLGEPIISSVLAWLLLSEVPGPLTFLGAPLVMMGIILSACRADRD